MQAEQMRKARGFTLVEMLTVVVVIAILISAAFRLGVYVNQKLGKQQTQVDLLKLKHAIDAYYKEYGSYPPLSHETMNVNLQYLWAVNTMWWNFTNGAPPPMLTSNMLYLQDGLAKYLCHTPECGKWTKYIQGFEINGYDSYSVNASAVWGLPYGWVSWNLGGWTLKVDAWGTPYHYASYATNGYQTYRLWSAGRDKQSRTLNGGPLGAPWTPASSTQDDIGVDWDP